MIRNIGVPIKTDKSHNFVLLILAVVLLAAGLTIFFSGSDIILRNSNDQPALDGNGAGNNGGRGDGGGNDDSTMDSVPMFARVGGERFAVGFTGDPAGVLIDNGSDKYSSDIGDAGTAILSACISDIDGDKTDEILVITGEAGQQYGSYFQILKLALTGSAVKISEMNRIDIKALNPWKVQTCDVDGDGRLEVSLGVYKTSRFHPVMAKRPFIYNLHENGISPKWRGSRLSRPFDDYMFSDIDSDGADEILSIEQLADGTKVVNSYAWKGFGFESIGESKAYDDILTIRKDETAVEGAQAIDACVITGGQGQWIKLFYKDGAILEMQYQ